MIDEHAIGERYRAVAGELDERQRRLWAASEARAAGRGGVAAVARATGIGEKRSGRGCASSSEGLRSVWVVCGARAPVVCGPRALVAGR